MAQARRGGQIQSKLGFLIYGNKGTKRKARMVACPEDRPLVRGHRPILFTAWRQGVCVVQWRQG